MGKNKVYELATNLFKSNLRNCRLKACIASQTALSRLSGVSHGTINAIENDKIFMSIHHALTFKDILGCSLDDLFVPRQSEPEYAKQIKED